MKKSGKLCAMTLAAVAAMAPAALTGCNNVKDDPNVLNIVALNAGYGKQWLETLAARFESEHPGYTVNLDNAIYEAGSLINSHINSRNNVDDLYICVGNNWKTYASSGKFAELDDFLNETVDGITVREKVASEYANSIYFPDLSDTIHTYRLPWTAGVGGIYYNKAMFEENAWKVPTTYTELIELCDKIVDDEIPVETSGNKAQSVKPFVYTGQNIDYFDYAVYTWWAQLSGEENIREFMQYGAPDNYNSAKSATYNNLKKATDMWKGLFGNSDYVMSGCSGMSNHEAQTAFNNGQAAMIFSGDWMYNEILNYNINNEHFELALMKTPIADGAVETSITYTIGEDQYIAIPESSSKKDLAKDFIKLIISDYGCEVFLNEAHGLLAYKTKNAITTEDSFLNNLMTTKNGYEKAFTNYPSFTAEEIAGQAKVSDNRLLYLTNTIDVWGTGALRPYATLIQSNPQTLDTAFTTIASSISGQWKNWQSDAGVTKG